MKLDIHAKAWEFLRGNNANAYVTCYKRHRQDGWKQLAPATTKRQFATAKEILDRMNQGQRGVLLADDVGLGKTTVAALCALVFAGKCKSVRILAPNEMMVRRWRQELEVHLPAIMRFAGHLKLEGAARRLNSHARRLTGGAIAVSTHQKAKGLACDLLIIDEAHRTRSEHSNLARRIDKAGQSVGRLLVLTATPFSIDPKDLARLLHRVGGAAAAKHMKDYAAALTDLWRGRHGSPLEMADTLAQAASLAVRAMKPFVIRHGIEDLQRREKRAFGTIDDSALSVRTEVSDTLLEAMLRADRALDLGKQCGVWERTRRNDPRYHVAVGKLSTDLTLLIDVAGGEDHSAILARHHGQVARRLLQVVGTHPKIVDTVRTAQTIVAQGEKVLIFCDHHQPASELAAALGDAIRWPEDSSGSIEPAVDQWRAAWQRIFKEQIAEAKNANDAAAARRMNTFIEWLMSDGVRSQITNWLALGGPSAKRADLYTRLNRTKARGEDACSSIAKHALELYKQMTDRESRSTRAILLRNEKTGLPGAMLERVAAACDPQGSGLDMKYPGVFYSGQPDIVLSVFNSPFGPDVLVATDSLSEGVDLHRFCRHLIHHELDPSPIRTVQRNGRLRRVACWAARCKRPIRILYPALGGTRDEKLVEVMRHRIQQFDLLLGGIGGDIDTGQAIVEPGNTAEILDYARQQLGRLGLGLLQQDL